MYLCWGVRRRSRPWRSDSKAAQTWILGICGFSSLGLAPGSTDFSFQNDRWTLLEGQKRSCGPGSRTATLFSAVYWHWLGFKIRDSLSIFSFPTPLLGILLIALLGASIYIIIFLSALEKNVDISIFMFLVFTENFPVSLYTLVLRQLCTLG